MAAATRGNSLLRPVAAVVVAAVVVAAVAAVVADSSRSVLPSALSPAPHGAGARRSTSLAAALINDSECLLAWQGMWKLIHHEDYPC